jgi:hypothetical protein
MVLLSRHLYPVPHCLPAPPPREQKIGDSLGCLLAETLTDYPLLESLNIAQCELTDASLIPLLKAVMELPNLEVLDLGGNDIDDRWDARVGLPWVGLLPLANLLPPE